MTTGSLCARAHKLQQCSSVGGIEPAHTNQPTLQYGVFRCSARLAQRLYCIVVEAGQTGGVEHVQHGSCTSYRVPT